MWPLIWNYKIDEDESVTKTDIILKPIGVIKTSASDDEIRDRRGDFDATVEIFQDFSDGLEGIDGFSHIFVLTFMHRLPPDQVGHLEVKPRRLLKKGFKPEELPLVGVFATSSPSRPNPIGISLVTLLRRDGSKLTVRGLDCFDGTPVLDIKPYKDDYRADDYGIAAWYHGLISEAARRA